MVHPPPLCLSWKEEKRYEIWVTSPSRSYQVHGLHYFIAHSVFMFPSPPTPMMMQIFFLSLAAHRWASPRTWLAWLLWPLLSLSLPACPTAHLALSVTQSRKSFPHRHWELPPLPFIRTSNNLLSFLSLGLSSALPYSPPGLPRSSVGVGVCFFLWRGRAQIDIGWQAYR